jgi:hypothetical protein
MIGPVMIDPVDAWGVGAMADREDATLLVQLAQWGTSLGLQDAMKTVFADDFDPEAASAQDDAVSRLLNFGETVGTLTKNGLLDTDLVLDWLWVSGAWSRVGPAAVKAREKLGVVQMYENFEALAAQQ